MIILLSSAHREMILMFLGWWGVGGDRERFHVYGISFKISNSIYVLNSEVSVNFSS